MTKRHFSFVSNFIHHMTFILKRRVLTAKTREARQDFKAHNPAPVNKGTKGLSDVTRFSYDAVHASERQV